MKGSRSKIKEEEPSNLKKGTVSLRTGSSVYAEVLKAILNQMGLHLKAKAEAFKFNFGI